MDSMYGDRENLKDTKNSTESNSEIISDSQNSLSYKKTNKLIAALFMVTDMLERDEPIRLKLRTLGVEILSDTTALSKQLFESRTEVKLSKKILEVVSFLDLAETINLISGMNSTILKKEFLELKNSLQDLNQTSHTFNGHSTLSGFFGVEEKFSITPPLRHETYSIGHEKQTRIGVQKGSTLMKALSDRLSSDVSVRNNARKSSLNTTTKEDFDWLKKQRRGEITDIVKRLNPTGASITDIRNSLQGSLVSSSEKTLQRELIAMGQAGLLKKTGSKRWSRYFLP